MFNLKTIIQNPKYFGLLDDIYLMEKLNTFSNYTILANEAKCKVLCTLTECGCP
jgi:hypothetical protein